MAKRCKAKKGTVMDKNKIVKYVLLPIIILLVAECIYLFWFITQQNSTYKNIDYIRSFMSSSGKLNDYQNKIGMHDPETDIKWYKTDDEIRIEFGRIYLTWSPERFYEQENLDHLSTIGITTKIKTDKDGNKTLHVYYMGKELERWIK